MDARQGTPASGLHFFHLLLGLLLLSLLFWSCSFSIQKSSMKVRNRTEGEMRMNDDSLENISDGFPVLMSKGVSDGQLQPVPSWELGMVDECWKRL